MDMAFFKVLLLRDFPVLSLSDLILQVVQSHLPLLAHVPHFDEHLFLVLYDLLGLNLLPLTELGPFQTRVLIVSLCDVVPVKHSHLLPLFMLSKFVVIFFLCKIIVPLIGFETEFLGFLLVKKFFRVGVIDLLFK